MHLLIVATYSSCMFYLIICVNFDDIEKSAQEIWIRCQFLTLQFYVTKFRPNMNKAGKKIPVYMYIQYIYIFLTSYGSIMNTYDAASGKKIMGFKGANMSC